jgi:hypothetical protein
MAGSELVDGGDLSLSGAGDGGRVDTRHGNGSSFDSFLA